MINADKLNELKCLLDRLARDLPENASVNSGHRARLCRAADLAVLLEAENKKQTDR